MNELTSYFVFTYLAALLSLTAGFWFLWRGFQVSWKPFWAERLPQLLTAGAFISLFFHWWVQYYIWVVGVC